MRKSIKYLLIVLLCAVNLFPALAQRKKKNKKQDKTENVANNEEPRSERKYNYAFGEALRYKVTYDLKGAEVFFKECIRLNDDIAAPFYELADIYHQLGRPVEALQYAEKAAKMEADNYWYQMMYVESLQKLDKNDRALGEIKKLTERYNDKPELFMKLSLMYFINGDYDKGIAVLEEQEKRYGPRESFIEPKKMAYLRLGKMDKAAIEIRKLIELNPDEIGNYLALAEVYRSNNEEEKALKVYEEVKEQFPGNGHLHLALAEFHQSKEDNEKAFEELKLAFKDPDLNIDTKVKILLSYYNLINKMPKYKSEAFELNEILVEVHPDEAKSHTIYGDFLYNERELEMAKEEFKRAIELDERPFAIWNQVIIIHAEMNEFDSVLAVSTKALELFPNQPSLYYFSGVANNQLKNYEAAITNFESGKKLIIENDPLMLQFHVSLGEAYNELKRYKESDASFDEALKIDSLDPNVLNNYSYYLSLRGEHLERAERMSAKSNNLAPNQSSYLDTYAWVLYKLQDYEKAKDWIEKALNNGGDKSAEVLEHAGDISFQLKDKAKALEYWEKAKQANGEGSPFLEQKIRDQTLYE